MASACWKNVSWNLRLRSVKAWVPIDNSDSIISVSIRMAPASLMVKPHEILPGHNTCCFYINLRPQWVWSHWLQATNDCRPSNTTDDKLTMRFRYSHRLWPNVRPNCFPWFYWAGGLYSGCFRTYEYYHTAHRSDLFGWKLGVMIIRSRSRQVSTGNFLQLGSRFLNAKPYRFVNTQIGCIFTKFGNWLHKWNWSNLKHTNLTKLH